jgi:hypothetical protein
MPSEATLASTTALFEFDTQICGRPWPWISAIACHAPGIGVSGSGSAT